MSGLTDIRQTIREAAKPALAALERMDSEQPSVAESDLSEAIELLIRLRDDLIGHRRNGNDCDEWLGRTNGMLSGIFGVEYPIAGIQWRRIQGTRDELRDMLGSVEKDQQR